MMLSAPFKSYSQLPLTITVVRFHLPGVPSSRWQSRSSYVFCPTILLPLHTMFPCIYILICLNRPPFLSSSRLLLYLASVTHIHPQTMVGGTAIHTIGASSGPSKPSAQRRPRQSGGGDLGGGSNVKRNSKARGGTSGGGSNASSYGQGKGVVNTLGGCTSSASQRYAEKKAENGGGGRAMGKAKVEPSKPQRQRIVRTLNGENGRGAVKAGGKAAGGKAAAGGQSDAEKRAAFFAAKFG